MNFRFNQVFFTKNEINYFKNLSFELKNQQILIVVYEDKIYKKNFINLILGHYFVKNGQILLGNKDITTAFKSERKVFLIKKNRNYFWYFLPTKLKFVFLSLLDPIFWYLKLSSFYNNLISFNLKKISKNNFQIELQKKLNTLLLNLINNVFKKCQNNIIKIQEDIKEFLKNNQIFDNQLKLPNILKNIIVNYLNLNAEIETLETNLIINQALFDYVEEFLDLKQSCNCEKKYPKYKKNFNYWEINFIVQKQLKLISQQIVIIRLNLATKKFIFFRYYFKIKKAMINNNFLKKNRKIVNDFLKQIKEKNYLNLNLKFNYKFLGLYSKFIKTNWKKNEIFIEKILNNNIMMLRIKIIELIHNYHKLLIAKKFKINFIKVKKNKKKLIESKPKIIIDDLTASIYQKALNVIKLLGFKRNIFFWNYSTLFSQIQTYIINAIIAKKELIIFDSVFLELNFTEQKKMFLMIERIKIYFPRTKFIFLTNQFFAYYIFNTSFLLLQEKNSNNNIIECEKLIEIWNDKVSKKIFTLFFDPNFNLIKVNKKNQTIIDQYLKVINNNCKKINLNPFLINIKRVQSDDLCVEGKIIKKSKKNLKYFKYCFLLTSKEKFLFFSQLNLKKLSKIKLLYIQKKAIIFN